MQTLILIVIALFAVKLLRWWLELDDRPSRSYLKKLESERLEYERRSPIIEAVLAQMLNRRPELDILGLNDLPTTHEELKQKYRKVMLVVHPDRGGSTEMSAKVNSAYETLSREYCA